ncbi:hypothetical protein P7C73_g3914, partial [Tremellales sp. Uapishka_1]
MPPKGSTARQVSISPPPPPSSADNNDFLIIQDIVDTLDQIPPELTRVHSDLNELGAVLYATLLNLEKKLTTLIAWIQDTSIGPEQRFQLLQEIAEEAARYKLGGDDKIRVAGGACDGIMAHQKHISNLLAASTLLMSGPPSPYTQSLTMSYLPPQSNSRRGVISRAANSPFGGRAYASGSGVNNTLGLSGDKGDTPTKKKKSRVQQLGMGGGSRDDDDAASVSGRDEKKKPAVKRKKTVNRAVSPTDSLASTSLGTKPEPQARTARQIAAAAAAKARLTQREEESDDESVVDDRRGKPGFGMQVAGSTDSVPGRDTLGLDVGSREGSAVGRSQHATPVIGGPEKARAARIRGLGKRSRQDEDDDEESEEEDREDRPPAAKRTTKKADPDVVEHESSFQDTEVDTQVYCTCKQVSFGEMIGCDNDDCEIEWYHIGCLKLDHAPEGNWLCPMCVEKMKKHPKKKPVGKAARARAGK